MYRSGSRVRLVSAEKEKNSCGEQVNKDVGFEYALPNLYPDDYLDEYIASLRERFAKKDPVEEMQRTASMTNADKACNKDAMACIRQEQASLLSVAGSLSYIAQLIRTLDCFVVQ